MPPPPKVVTDGHVLPSLKNMTFGLMFVGLSSSGMSCSSEGGAKDMVSDVWEAVIVSATPELGAVGIILRFFATSVTPVGTWGSRLLCLAAAL